jgi:hypothetical protein
MMRYIELKSDHGDRGPAWIAEVETSRSGSTVYFDGRALKRCAGISGNHVDADTGEEFWVSGVKLDGHDRHPCGGGVVWIEAHLVEAWLALTGRSALDPRQHQIIAPLPRTARSPG